jgi:hypothetical protein
VFVPHYGAYKGLPNLSLIGLVAIEIGVIIYPEIVSITHSPVMALEGTHALPHKT